MDEEYKKLIFKLNENIHKLILLYKENENENCKLKKELEELTKEKLILENRIKTLEEKYDKLKTAKTLEKVIGDTGEARHKLNRIIREIDNCIALLNK